MVGEFVEKGNILRIIRCFFFTLAAVKPKRITVDECEQYRAVSVSPSKGCGKTVGYCRRFANKL